MIMEKLLTKHTGQWKIKEMNFEMTGNIKDNAQNIVTSSFRLSLEVRPGSTDASCNKVPSRYISTSILVSVPLHHWLPVLILQEILITFFIPLKFIYFAYPLSDFRLAPFINFFAVIRPNTIITSSFKIVVFNSDSKQYKIIPRKDL